MTRIRKYGRYSLRVTHGFTLIEILVVVSIIIILLGAVVAIGSNIRNSSYARATQGILQTLAQAAKQFRDTTKKEVSGGYLGDFKSVPQCLQIINRIPASNVTGSTVLDAWGNAIIYNTSTSANLPEGYFQSIGPDGIANNTDDLRNTEATQ
jgi:prepilin-type N-terminal cleavage/methylation domain-containing protein